MLLRAGANVYLSLIISFIIGCLTGLITGLLIVILTIYFKLSKNRKVIYYGNTLGQIPERNIKNRRGL